MRACLYLSALLMLGASAAGAYDPIVVDRGWYRVDRFEDAGCRGEVGTNGQFYVISVAGLKPGGPALLRIENGDMPPIARAVRADGAGSWQQYYIPFRPNRGAGGRVFARVSDGECSIPLSFDWQRRKGWEDRPPLSGASDR